MDFVKRFARIVAGVKVPEKERRRVRRTTCKLPVEIRTEKSSVPATLTEISVLGATFQAQGPVKTGLAAVAMPSTTKGLIRCKIVWASGTSGGLVFQDTEDAKNQSWVKDVLVSAGFSQDNIKERRRHIRVRTQLPTYITSRADDTICEGQMLNIGRAGAMMVSSTEVALGTRCKLKLDPYRGLPTLDVEAICTWVRKDSTTQKYFIGVTFEYDDDPNVIKLVSGMFK